jgi:hypothetical protein
LAVASGPAHGSASISGTTAIYTPTASYYGADSFTYNATGPGGTSASATVSLSVGTPPAPTVSPVSASTAYNTAVGVGLSPSGAYSSLAVASGPAHGSASISGTTATYTPTAGYYGADSFTYTATGPGGTSAPASVSITVASNNQAPTCSNKTLNLGGIPNMGAGVAITINPVTYAPACTDPDGDALTLVSATGFTNAAFGSISGPNLTISNIKAGGTTFTFAVSDGQGHIVYPTFTILRSY